MLFKRQKLQLKRSNEYWTYSILNELNSTSNTINHKDSWWQYEHVRRPTDHWNIPHWDPVVPDLTPRQQNSKHTKLPSGLRPVWRRSVPARSTGSSSIRSLSQVCMSTAYQVAAAAVNLRAVGVHELGGHQRRRAALSRVALVRLISQPVVSCRTSAVALSCLTIRQAIRA